MYLRWLVKQPLIWAQALAALGLQTLKSALGHGYEARYEATEWVR